MTVAQKVFGFFAICLVATMVLPSVKTPEAPKEYAKQCANGEATQLVMLEYKGKVIEKTYVPCPR